MFPPGDCEGGISVVREDELSVDISTNLSCAIYCCTTAAVSDVVIVGAAEHATFGLVPRGHFELLLRVGWAFAYVWRGGGAIARSGRSP